MKIGIYGGSFSPPHSGHVKFAESFIDAVKPDRLIVVPAGNPPHKRIDGGADGKQRLEMCRAAFLPLSPAVEVSDFEVFRTDPCYTVDTLRHFSSEGELYMLCGSDMFFTLEKWRHPEEIFRLAVVVCGARVSGGKIVWRLEEASEKYRRLYGARTMIIDFEPEEVSSTEIRRSLGMGVTPEGLCTGVLKVIQKYGRYGCKI